MEDLLGIALRVSIMYCYALAVLRLSGKRSIGDLSPLDFLVAMAVGDMFDDIIWSEVPLAQGLVGFSVFMLCHTGAAYGAWRSAAFMRLVDGRPRQLVRDGRVDLHGLAAERMRPDTLEQELRQVGEDQLEALELVCLEVSGQPSVLRRKRFRPLQRQDVPALSENSA